MTDRELLEKIRGYAEERSFNILGSHICRIIDRHFEENPSTEIKADKETCEHCGRVGNDRIEECYMFLNE